MAPLQYALLFDRPFALLLVRTLVVQVLAFTQTDLQFGAVVLPVSAQGINV